MFQMWNYKSWSHILDPEQLVEDLNDFGAYIDHVGLSKKKCNTVIVRVSVPEWINIKYRHKVESGREIVADYLADKFGKMAKKTHMTYEIEFMVRVNQVVDTQKLI